MLHCTIRDPSMKCKLNIPFMRSLCILYIFSDSRQREKNNLAKINTKRKLLLASEKKNCRVFFWEKEKFSKEKYQGIYKQMEVLSVYHIASNS